MNKPTAICRCAAALLLLFLAFAPAASGAEKAMGLRLGYNTRSESPTAGLWFQYSFSEHVRLTPNVDYYFRHNFTDALAINFNMNFPFKLAATGKVAVYPLVGFSYTSWNHHVNKTTHDGDDVTSRTNRFGLNVGGGIDYRVSPTLKLFLEAKGAFIKSYSSATISLGLGYCF